MPDSNTHSALTRSALSLLKIETGDNQGLIEEYCTYPDRFFSEKSEEFAPYNFFLDGIQFHYPPDTPYVEFYRYWTCEKGKLRRNRKFVNENFRHVTAGFTFCVENVISHFQKGEMEEGKKFMGILLHMLEDSTFGLHAMEGAGGADAFYLDRLIEGNIKPAAILASLRFREDFPLPDYTPCSLGNTPEEMVMRLYAAYCQKSSASRKCCFQYVMNILKKRESENRKLEEAIFENAVTLCADAIHTLFQLARGEKAENRSFCRLEDLEPYEFPFGGFGSYRFRSIERNCAYDRKDAPLKLALEEGSFANGLSFGSHWEGNLKYFISPGSFREFRGKIGLHPAYPVDGKVEMTLINQGKEVESFILDETHKSKEILIPSPGKEFGFSFQSSPGCGIIVLADPVLYY